MKNILRKRGIKKFIEILEKTTLPKCEEQYTDYEGSYCSMGAVAKELGFDPALDDWFESKMKRALGFDTTVLNDKFFQTVIQLNDEFCGNETFKCVAKELRKEFL